MSEARKNLLSGTKDWSGVWERSNSWYADGTHDGFAVMSRKGAWAGLHKPVKLVAGKTYTFSACVKVDSGQDHVVGIYLTVSDTVNDTDLATSEIDDHFRRFHDVADGGWHIISHTFTPTASKCVRARVEANGDFALSVCAYMLVEGSTPAAWAPAEGETLTADGGSGGMTEPTNLVKTQPDETAIYTVKANDGHKDFLNSDLGDRNIKLSANISCHIGITIKPDKDIPSRHVWAWIRYKDDAGAGNFANSSKVSYVIPAGVWTRLEWTVAVPAGMILDVSSISIDSLSDEIKFQATNFVVYPLTGGRIVRARGATAGYISKAKEATVLYTPSKSARQVRVILLDETGSSIYDIQSVAIVADAEELQGKVAAQESSIQTIQSDMTTVQSGLSGLNVRLASMQTELAGVSAGDVLYQVPYTVTDGKATFTAAVYKAGVECHTSYDPSCFTWYRKSEAGTVKIGTGYSVTVNVTDVGYGGFVVGVFETLNGGSSDAAVLDAACKSVLDGTNTTRVFWEFYPRAAAAGETSKYKILERFAKAAAQAWNSKTYTLRSYDAAVSGNTAMTPLDDLEGKSAAQLCTASDAAVEDWADEDPMTWYIRANAMSLEDGTMNITFFEGEDGFDITGEDAPVWTFALALWIKEWNDGSFNFISFRTTKGAGFYPDAGDVAPDGTKRALTWHPSFPGGLNSSGALTSGAGIRPYNFASATAGITAARKMTIYEGLWNDCDTRWILRMWQLRHFNLENSNIADGCISYNRQYQVAKAEENVKRVILSTTQAANLIVGSTVSIGDMGSSTNKDRGQAHMRNILDLVKISFIETVTIDGDELAAVGIETESTFTTTATTYISTMPWHSGATELLPGRKDGCPHGLTNGTSPLRVAGVEVLDGAYAVGLDPLYTVTANAVSDWDYSIYECRDSQNLAGSVTSNYEDTGLLYEGMKSGWNYVKSFMKTKKGVLFPEEAGGSATTYFKSAFAGPGSAGVRCPWRFANLYNGASAGLACEYGTYAPGAAVWYGRPRLCGAGKKRGEWTS